MTMPIEITDELVSLIASYQDIQEAHVYQVVTSEDFDPLVPDLAEELGCEEDEVTQESERDILGTEAFTEGLTRYVRARAENELYTAVRLWARGPAILYREIRLDVDPTRLKDAIKSNLGESWTPDPNKAISYFNEGGKYGYTLRASVPFGSVDWTETLIRRCNLDLGEHENEITLKHGAPVRLLGITLEDGTELDFADWISEEATA